MIGVYRYPIGTTLAEVQQAKAYRPDDAGMFWKGIAHSKLVESVLEFASKYDLQIRAMRFNLSRNDCDIAFSCNIIQPDRQSTNGLIDGKQAIMLPAFGFIASNTRRHRLTYYAGWSNPKGLCAFVGTRWRGSRYTTHAQQQKNIEEALVSWDKRMANCVECMKQLRAMTLTSKKADRLLIEAGSRSLIPWGRIGRVARLIKKHKTISAWEFLIDFSSVIVMNPPIHQMNQLYEFGQLLLNS